MKTIPVSLILAGLLAPHAALAEQPAAPPPGEGRGPGQQHPPVETWRAADKDDDGFITREEFAALPRIRKLPEEKRPRLFDRLDKNADGKLSRDELARSGRPPHGGPHPPMRRLWELDADKSGGVNFEEFQQGPHFKKLPPERQSAIFKRLDRDGDGSITPKDRPPPPPRHDGPRPWRPDGKKPQRPQPDPLRMLRKLDTDGDGALSLEEFRAGPAAKKIGEAAQEEHFEAMDRNHDQKLTPEDFPPPPPPPRDEAPDDMGPPPPPQDKEME